ncbi:diguanylate cyclase domain-containing protein [Candidatus Nitrotoga sp. BS]|uniref:diguanylate cyclase domain-containing protein n=1 Tax=Candidatus Nitrotoga sp. BS TaxID=2890408 RepID=UPI001EF1923D|nr:diguanylate cyclase [Candidatus Nitrotoga sp. BS]
MRRGIESAVWKKRQVTVSVSVTEMTDINTTSANLIESADQALSQAKHKGRNQVAQTP